MISVNGRNCVDSCWDNQSQSFVKDAFENIERLTLVIDKKSCGASMNVIFDYLIAEPGSFDFPAACLASEVDGIGVASGGKSFSPSQSSGDHEGDDIY